MGFKSEVGKRGPPTTFHCLLFFQAFVLGVRVKPESQLHRRLVARPQPLALQARLGALQGRTSLRWERFRHPSHENTRHDCKPTT